MKPPRQAVGRQDELSAKSPLEGNGYSVPAGNSAHGGVDQAASQDQELVFVKVNALPSPSFACPDASVTSPKQTHLPSDVEIWLDQHPERGNTWQFGIPAVEGEPGATTEIEDCGYAIG